MGLYSDELVIFSVSQLSRFQRISGNFYLCKWLRKTIWFKENMKVSMKNCGIDLDKWKNISADRYVWHSQASTGITNIRQTRYKSNTKVVVLFEKSFVSSACLSHGIEFTPIMSVSEVYGVCHLKCVSS